MAEGIKGFLWHNGLFFALPHDITDLGTQLQIGCESHDQAGLRSGLSSSKKGKGHSDLQCRFNLLQLLPVTATFDSALNDV